MPFDPKIIRQDEEWLEQSELQLPDDLGLLGEQLCDDAQRLAACYPSASARSMGASSVTSYTRPWIGRRLLAMSSAVAAAAALGVLAALTVQQTIRDLPSQPGVAIHDASASPGTDSTPLAFQKSTAAEQAQGDLPFPQSEELLTPAGFSGATPTISPALLDQGITSPELEGWMDLRQNDLAMDAESIEF